MNKRFFTAALCGGLMLGGSAVPAFAMDFETADLEAAAAAKSGKIGSADWSIDANGVLTIGAGSFTNRDPNFEWPWTPYYAKITRVDGRAAFKLTGSASCMFNNLAAKEFDLSGWDTSAITEMNSMFVYCRSLEKLNTTGWDTSSVKNFNAMFHMCERMKTIEVAHWNMSSAEDLNMMFDACLSLTSLDVGGWDVSSVKNMSAMFAADNYGYVTDGKEVSDTKLTLDLSRWDTSSVEGMGGMFKGRRGLSSVDVGNWDVSSVVSIKEMFENCSSLSSLDVARWNTSALQQMDEAFKGCSSLKTLDVSRWNTSNVTILSNMFNGCSSLSSIDLESWRLDALDPGFLQYIPLDTFFKGCTKLESIRYTDSTKQLLSSLPEKSGWYQNNDGPFSVEKLPALQKGKSALLTRKKTQIPGQLDDAAAVPVSMHRLYNPNSGEHFYTTSTAEKDNLVSVGWKYEGEGWKAPETSKTPVFRLYNPNAGDHHYTLDVNEKNHLVKVGWNNEGIGWYSDDAKAIPLYRQYNPNAKAGSHNYTTNKGENDGLVRLGWKAEGIGWYGLK